jgi:hypothetical protein
MEATAPPEIVREKTSRLTGGRLSCTLILERELTGDEIRRFYSLASDDSPRPGDYQLQGRILRYDCALDEEAKWRLSAQIYLVKAFRVESPARRTTTDVRRRLGLPTLYR